MKPVFAIVTGLVLVSVAAAALPSVSTLRAKTATVTVHCANGADSAFVTPARVRIAVGDSVEWEMAGNVASDSIVITLKDSKRTWPFAGRAPRGRGRADAQAGVRSDVRANRAHTRGTFAYNVDLLCHVPGGGARPIRIDPDIIIE